MFDLKVREVPPVGFAIYSGNALIETGFKTRRAAEKVIEEIEQDAALAAERKAGWDPNP